MRVALVTSLHRGGPVEHSLILARGLTDTGIDVDAVCATADLGARFASAGARPHVLPLRHRLDAAAAVRIRRALRGADVVHAQDRRSGLWTRVLHERRGTARVYTVHGLPDPYLPPPVGPQRPGLRARLAYAGLDASLARRTDALTVPSRALAAALVDRLGFPRARVRVIPNGVPPATARRRGAEVGTLSALEPVKAIDVFLAAAAQLAVRRPAPPFAVFGTGSQAAALRRRAAALGLDGRVAFPGHVPTAQALDRLGVLVLPSCMESCPLALLEAMAAGVPVVASRVGGVPELAPPGTARLVAPGDARALAAAIASLLDDPVGAEAQAAAARRHVTEAFSAERMTARTAELYAGLLAERA